MFIVFELDICTVFGVVGLLLWFARCFVLL